MSGISPVSLEIRWLPMAAPFIKKEERACFLKAKVNGGQVEVLDKQGSDMLLGFANADALIYIPANKSGVGRGEEVEVHMLPS